MNKYFVEYLDTDGDINNIWIYANSVEDAEFKVRSQYWNFDKLVNCYETVYTTLDDDFTSAWLEASNEEDAKEELKREYWDVKRIDMVEEI